jgi:hypothetical protein
LTAFVAEPRLLLVLASTGESPPADPPNSSATSDALSPSIIELRWLPDESLPLSEPSPLLSSIALDLRDFLGVLALLLP